MERLPPGMVTAPPARSHSYPEFDIPVLEAGDAPGWPGAKSEYIGNIRAMSNAARRDAAPAER